MPTINTGESRQKGIQNFLKALTDMGDLAANETRLKSKLLANQIEKKQNFLYKIQEQLQKNQMTQDLMKKMQEQGGQGGMEDLNAPKLRAGEGGEAKVFYPTARDKEFNIKMNLNEISQKEQRGIPLEPQEQSFKETYGGMGENKGKTLISPMVTKISQNEDAYYNLSNAVEGLKTNADKFSQFMGPGKDILRNPLRSYVNKDLQDFLAWKANVQDAFQSYRVAVTGAQASDKEIASLVKNRPTENDTYDVFVKKTNEVRKIGNKVITRYIENLGKSGYNISGFRDTLINLNNEMGILTGDEQSKQISLPQEIKTTSQAIDYLIKNNGMNKDQAIEWLRSQ